MAEVRRWRYNDWQQFKRELIPDLFADSTFHRGQYLFRGVRDAGWTLSPKFDRVFSYLGAREKVTEFGRLVAAFKEACEAHDVPSAVLSDERLLMALGQHYGLPTRLLDWTESPYVAAFFAYYDAVMYHGDQLSDESGAAAAVWALHLSSDIWSEEMGVSLVRASSIGNVRLRNQGGSFTLSRTPFASLEEFVERTSEPGVALTQIALPLADARTALSDLDVMGINPARLFPDLTGAADLATLRVLLETEGSRVSSTRLAPD